MKGRKNTRRARAVFPGKPRQHRAAAAALPVPAPPGNPGGSGSTGSPGEPENSGVPDSRVSDAAPRGIIPGFSGSSDFSAFSVFSERFGAGEAPCVSLTDDPRRLTELYRRSWLAKRIVDMPCEDMTRAWYALPPSVPEEDAEALRRLEARHGIRREITDAVRWARLYGGACALMVLRGQERRLADPLDPEEILPGDFQGLLVRDRAGGVEPSVEIERNLDDPDFGYPAFYDFETEELGRLRVHHSRILRFTGRDLPRMEEVAGNYWGASELEHLLEELEKRSATSRNIARLVFQANVTTLKISDLGEALALGTAEQRRQALSVVAEQNRLRDSFGLQLLSAGDDFENHPYSFAGLSEVYEAFMMDMAGAAGIPATRLFGRSPDGMNATGESDLKNYYEMIDGMRERSLRPALEKLLPVMALSCWGFVPEDLTPSFPSLAASDPREEAEIRARNTESLIRAMEAGLLSPAEARERLERFL